MTRATMQDWFGKNAVQLVAYAVAIGITWATLTAAVGRKAEQADLDKLAASVVAHQREADETLPRVLRLICRIPDVRLDSGCDGYRQQETR
jgi:hypothetical protein